MTIPHVRSVDEAKQAIGFFRDARANVWSPSNRTGDRIAMLMLEDPAAVAQAREIADLTGYSILACGIGSLAAGARRRSRGRRSGHAEGAGGSAAREARRHAHVQRPGCREAREGRISRAADQGAAADDAIKAGRAAAGKIRPIPQRANSAALNRTRNVPNG